MNPTQTDIGTLKAQMIKEWGLQEMPPAEQDKMVDELGEVLFKSIVLRVSDTLTDADKDELASVADQNPTNAGAVLDFLREKSPDFDKIASAEVATLKRQFVFAA
jgi:hypothetical protein